MLLQFEDLIQKGNTIVCPKCKKGGIKDENCTHITCDKCEATEFCFWCEEEIDITNPFDHNSRDGYEWY